MLSQCYIPLEVNSCQSPADFIEDPSGELKCSSKIGVAQSKGIVGSAYMEFGNSKVICCVMCPRSATRQTVHVTSLNSGAFECDLRFASHIVHEIDISDKFSHEEKMSSWVQSTLQSAILLQNYPKQLITLSITVLQSSKYDLSAIINCSSLALADASIHMRDLTCAYSLFFIKDTNKLDTDSSGGNLSASRSSAQFTVAVMPSLGVTSNTCIEGRWSAERIAAADKELVDKCSQMKSLMMAKLKQRSQ